MECKYPEFAEYLRDARKRTGKTQRAIAETAPVTHGRIGQLEQGFGIPSLRHLRGLAAAYEVEYDEMLDRLLSDEEKRCFLPLARTLAEHLHVIPAPTNHTAVAHRFPVTAAA